MQRLFLRMMAGNVKNTEPDFESRAYLPKGHKVTTSQWTALVPEAYIWMVRVPRIKHNRMSCYLYRPTDNHISCYLFRITFRFLKSASTSKVTRQISSRP